LLKCTALLVNARPTSELDWPSNTKVNKIPQKSQDKLELEEKLKK